MITPEKRLNVELEYGVCREDIMKPSFFALYFLASYRS